MLPPRSSRVRHDGATLFVDDPWGNLIELAVNDALFITEEGYTELRGS